MKKIRITNGTYGYRPNGGLVVEPKNSDSVPFEVEDAEAARLVSLGVAAIVDEVAAMDPPAGDPGSALVYNEEMKLDELKDVAREVGATEDELKPLRSKKEVIALIDKILDGSDDEEDDEDDEDDDPPASGDPDAPQIGAADPV